MAADDLKPTRMDAAKAAATAFVARQPSRASSSASWPSATPASRSRRPTDGPSRRCSPRSTGSSPSSGTSLGQGICASLNAIATAEGASTRGLLHATGLPTPTPTPTPVPRGLPRTGGRSSCSPTARTTSRPDPVAGGAGGRRPRRADLHGRDRQHDRDDARRRRLQGPHAARRGDPPADRRRSPAGRTTTRPTSDSPDAIYDEPRPAADDQAAGRSRSPRSSRARASCLLIAGARLALRGWAGCRDRSRGRDAARPAGRAADDLPVAAACSLLLAGPVAGGRLRLEPRGAGARSRCATRASAWSARRCPGRRDVRRHLPFALFLLRARSPDRRPRPAGRDRQRPDEPDHDHPRPSTSRAACARRTSHRAGSTPPRTPPSRSSTARARRTADRDRRVQRVRGGGPATDRTTDQALLAALHSLTTGRRTAIGSGILSSIDAIAEIDPSVAPSVDDGRARGRAGAGVPGAYAPDIVVLLTDGVEQRRAGARSTRPSRRPIAALRVYTIGFGTAEGGSFDPICAPQFIGNEPGGGFGGGWRAAAAGRRTGRFRRGIDEDTLNQVADLTGGTYYPAESAEPARAGLLGPPDQPDHQARGGRGQRRVRRARRGPGRRSCSAGLATAAPAERLAPSGSTLLGRAPMMWNRGPASRTRIEGGTECIDHGDRGVRSAQRSVFGGWRSSWSLLLIWAFVIGFNLGTDVISGRPARRPGDRDELGTSASSSPWSSRSSLEPLLLRRGG